MSLTFLDWVDMEADGEHKIDRYTGTKVIDPVVSGSRLNPQLTLQAWPSYSKHPWHIMRLGSKVLLTPP